MTRYFILPILFLAAFLLNAPASQANANKATRVSVSEQVDIGTAAQSSQVPPVKNMPALPATKPFQPVQKTHGHAPTMDELAHMHHFHKGRVKKKKHYQKVWMLSKVLLILCHVAILVIAYLHATH